MTPRLSRLVDVDTTVSCVVARDLRARVGLLEFVALPVARRTFTITSRSAAHAAHASIAVHIVEGLQVVDHGLQALADQLAFDGGKPGHDPQAAVVVIAQPSEVQQHLL